MQDDFIWIEDAAKEYQRSRSWLDEQIAARVLSVVKIPGIRRIYLLRSELDQKLKPQITPAKDADQQTG